jgi:hypothetical protein
MEDLQFPTWKAAEDGPDSNPGSVRDVSDSGGDVTLFDEQPSSRVADLGARPGGGGLA